MNKNTILKGYIIVTLSNFIGMDKRISIPINDIISYVNGQIKTKYELYQVEENFDQITELIIRSKI